MPYVVNLRQGIEDLQVRAARGFVTMVAFFSQLHLQAEIGHLLPWFTSHVNPDFKKWKEDNGVVAVPVSSQKGNGRCSDERLTPSTLTTFFSGCRAGRR